MPLTRHTITSSSQVMLIAYPVFFVLVAAGYILGDPARTSSPSFDYVRGIQPIHVWGFLFLAVGLLEVLAWIRRSRQSMLFALCGGFAVSLMWTLGFALSLLSWHHGPVLTPDVSLNAPSLWGFVTVAHIASLRSLTRDAS